MTSSIWRRTGFKSVHTRNGKGPKIYRLWDHYMKKAAYSVVLYCPDTNLKSDGETYKTKGLGGGKTALIKLASAFAKAGCKVTFYACTDGGTYDGVKYVEYEKFDGCDADVLMVFTGHKLDLRELGGKNIRAAMKILLVGGASPIKGLDIIDFDFYYAVSRYLKERLVKEWGLKYEKVLAVEHGYDPEDILPVGPALKRDMRRIIFASHPSKGLRRVIDIVADLRKSDPRFSLDVYGNARLWDERDTNEIETHGETWIGIKGMVGQLELVQTMHSYGFMLHLTEYPDLQSLVVQQAKKAGVITIASNVGGNSELIENGHDGFIIDEHYMSDACAEKVITLVTRLIKDEKYAAYIRSNAEKHSLTWEQIAKDWIDHWDEVLRGKKRKKILLSGYYGFKNLGDEAILSCIIRDLRSIDSRLDIAVVSNDPLYTEKTHKVRSLPSDNFELLVKEMETSDLFVLGGGGLFQDHDTMKMTDFFDGRKHGTTTTSYAALPLLARICRKPVMYYAQGVGPLFSRESSLFTRWALELADDISVRDEYSYFTATELLDIDQSKISLTCDPVMNSCLPDKRRAKALLIFHGIPEYRKLVLVSVRSWTNKGLEDNVIASLSMALSSFLDDCPDYHVIFVPFYTEEGPGRNDTVISGQVAKTLPADRYTIISRYDDYQEILALYRCAEFSIGMRFHSLIFSALAGTPVIPLSYEIKTDELIRGLNISEYSIDIRNISHPQLLEYMTRIKGLKNAEALEAIIAQHPFALGTLVYRSILDWNIPLFQRPHQLAKAFAKRGFLVFYCTPNYEFDYYDTGFTEVSERLYIYHGDLGVFNVLPEYIVFLNWNIFDALKPFNKPKIVYDYIDRIELLSVYNEQVHADHLDLIRTADLVSVTADDLFKEVSSIRDDIILCPNAADPGHFRTERPEVPEDIRDIVKAGKPIIGYYGALAEWFDYGLLKYVARERPQYNLLIVGYDYDGSCGNAGLEAFGNILRTGPVHYGILQNYLYYFDVAIIPFKISKITAAASPIKLFEYASARKPIAATALPECEKYEGVLISKSSDEFLSNIDKALRLRDDEEHLGKLDALAETNSWDKRVQQFVSEFEKKGLVYSGGPKRRLPPCDPKKMAGPEGFGEKIRSIPAGENDSLKRIIGRVL